MWYLPPWHQQPGLSSLWSLCTNSLWHCCEQQIRLAISFLYPKLSYPFTNECNYRQISSESNGNCSLAQWEEKWKMRSFFSYLSFQWPWKKASEISRMNLGTSFLAEIIISWLIILYLNSLWLQLPWTFITLVIFLVIRSLSFCLLGQSYPHWGQCLSLTLDCVTSEFLLCVQDSRSGYVFVLAAL